ncbi:rhomboid family intramembrane serine protease [Dyella acidiphila]|uniref:Rhomboid family intramembrane serine protease n=1 Tax=Dyella acidiphila TaxID=2775866 RepID=A0ABR9G7S9_9GAMM|nr:rhomboid family intramembrane serine protease [Dyella acidiphila]MBE1160078.1 rhomboid family intramembrane serine protease [Dyella acidiphila]
MPTSLPPVTRYLLIANVAVFLLQQVMGDFLIAHFALWPWGPDQLAQGDHGSVFTVGFRLWQLLTYAFMHGGLLHISFNMYALYMFGATIERTFGSRNFTLYYAVCAVTAALAQLLVVKYFTHGYAPTLGASGAIFGLLLAFGMLYPQEKLMLIFLPVPIPAWLFVIGYGAVELVLGVTGKQADVAHFAHLGGMLGGFLMIEYWRGKLPIKPRSRLMR